MPILFPTSSEPVRTYKQAVASLTKVGPKGYIHGWIRVGDEADSRHAIQVVSRVAHGEKAKYGDIRETAMMHSDRAARTGTAADHWAAAEAHNRAARASRSGFDDKSAGDAHRTAHNQLAAVHQKYAMRVDRGMDVPPPKTPRPGTKDAQYLSFLQSQLAGAGARTGRGP